MARERTEQSRLPLRRDWHGAVGPEFDAEGYHQQYLAKDPNDYCGIGGTGVSCPVGVART